MGTPRIETTATAGNRQGYKAGTAAKGGAGTPATPLLSSPRHPNATPLAPPHPHTLPPAAAAVVGTKGGGGEGTIPPITPIPATSIPFPPRLHAQQEEEGGGGGG
ncbi:unnamed protein product [Closterium sp. NIES-53]